MTTNVRAEPGSWSRDTEKVVRLNHLQGLCKWFLILLSTDPFENLTPSMYAYVYFALILEKYFFWV